MTWKVTQCLDGSWMIIVNGYQWGNDPEQFDHSIGCSTQTWPTIQEAILAYEESK